MVDMKMEVRFPYLHKAEWVIRTVGVVLSGGSSEVEIHGGAGGGIYWLETEQGIEM